MDKKEKIKLYDLEGTTINLYQVVEMKKEYKEEAFPAYGYYGILAITIDDKELVKTLSQSLLCYLFIILYFL